MRPSIPEFHSRSRRRVLTGGVAALGTAIVGDLTPGRSFAAGRPIRLVVPYSAGGPGDLLGRVLAKNLGDIWNIPVIVENRPGAGGSIGADAVARARPDGNTLLITAAGFVMNAGMLAKLPYDPIRSFTPIAEIAYQPLILSINKDYPARTLADFIALARRSPGTLSVGNAGVGTASHLAAVLLENRANIKLLHVPFGGSSQIQTALMSGVVQASFLNPSIATPMVEAGSLRALAVTSLTRWHQMPDVSTVAEQGFPGYDCSSWYGVLGPAGVPAARIQQLYEGIRKAMLSDAVRRAVDAGGLEELVKGPEDFAAIVRQDYTKWTDLIKRAKLKP